MAAWSNVEVHPHPTKGRALRAATFIPAGQIIQIFSPTLLIPITVNIERQCTYCFRTCQAHPCSRCRVSYYCNATCQAADWKAIHSKECKALAKIGRPLPTPVRALFQCLVKDGIAKGIEPLEGHVERRRKGKGGADLELMAFGALKFAGKDDSYLEKAVELLCKIHTNSFYRDDDDTGEQGIFLEPTLAMANHSCIPNATVQFLGRKAYLKAETHIDKGVEIEISYTDFTMPLQKRKEALAQYMFDCQCPRCAGDLNIYQTCALIAKENHYAADSRSPIGGSPTLNYGEDVDEIQSIKDFNGTALSIIEKLATVEDLPLEERLVVLGRGYRRCRAMTERHLLAVTPISAILKSMSLVFSDQGKFGFSLVLECLLMTECESYRRPWPQTTSRAISLFTIAKLMTNTLPGTLGADPTIFDVAPKYKAVAQKVKQTLEKIDQVSLCQMTAMLVMKMVDPAIEKEWSVAAETKEILADIEGLPGRKEDLKLILKWRDNPIDVESRRFFDFAFNKSIEKLAAVGEDVLAVASQPNDLAEHRPAIIHV